MIKLQNNYEIQSDGNSYQLVINTGKQDKDGKTVYNAQGYYSSLEQCLQAYCCKNMMNKVSKEEMSLQDVLRELQELKKEVVKYD